MLNQFSGSHTCKGKGNIEVQARLDLDADDSSTMLIFTLCLSLCIDSSTLLNRFQIEL